MAKPLKYGEEYVCEACGEKFNAEGDNERAEREYKENFGQEIDYDKVSVVCDDCSDKIKKALFN